jgi:uncharacterized circularly permuted ATP-grasp superfamily protein/uncharacterized alpha-E superfamily protein
MDLFHDYRVSPTVYDEMFVAENVIRAHWQPLMQTMGRFGARGFQQRWEQARRILYEHGVTRDPHDDQQGAERPWELDVVPMLLASDEWHRLEAGLIQRARLINALLADVYGPQRLLQAGLLAPELVFAHAGFLRPCHALPHPDGRFVHMFAVDLARTSNGQWQVLADRVQHPSGIGYTLENRLILSRTLSDVFRQHRVQHLTSFFDTWRQRLIELAPAHRDNPHVVLLTPKSDTSSHFEHVYLARYLGATLVEGTDLTVRANGVFLKTLAGLQPVDVILRQLADAYCDPLPLREDTGFGTAGLLQAVRAGRVVLLNTPGSGWVETPALLPYLPALCRHLLGEVLQIEAMPVWWCGQPESLTYVLEHLEELDIATAMPQYGGESWLQGHLHQAAPRRLARLLRAHSHAFIARSPLSRSTAPVWNGTGMRSGYIVLRAYVVATADGYMVMPGGLSRVSFDAHPYCDAIRRDDGSKDTWVIADGPQQAPSLFAIRHDPLALRRSSYNLPSRVADNLLWLGRYAERAEGSVRLLRSVLYRLIGDTEPAGNAALPVLGRALSRIGELPSDLCIDARSVADNVVTRQLLDLLYNAKMPTSIRAILASLHRVASGVRDRISADAWHILAMLDSEFVRSQTRDPLLVSDAIELLDQGLVTLAAFSGLGMENMTRGPGWRFLDIGRRLERMMFIGQFLRHTVCTYDPHEVAVMGAVLEVADSSMTYRSRYHSVLQFAPLLDLLLTDDTNPRSMLYQAVALAEHIADLPRDAADPSLSAAQRLIMTTLSALRLAQIEALCHTDAKGQRPHLIALLEQCGRDMPALAETLALQYLSHSPPSRHLAVDR